MVHAANSLSVKAFALSTTLLWFKFIVTARLQAVNQFLAGSRPPEDNKLAALLKKKGPKQNYGLAPVDEKDERMVRAQVRAQRWKQMVANDTESIPVGLLVFAAGLFTEANEKIQLGALGVFTLARFTHSYVYAKGMQPHRSIAWRPWASPACLWVPSTCSSQSR
jgi:hypothetical protein